MGGKSSSSSSTTTSTENQQADASGVITGGVIQGGGAITLNDYFPADVGAAFNSVLDLLGQTIQGAGQVAQQSIQSVADRTEAATQPELSVVTKLVPVAMLAIGVVAVYFLTRKK